MKNDTRGELWVNSWNKHALLMGTSLIHIVNDGVFVAIYPLIPPIAREFRLSFGEVGVLKTLFSSSSSLFQIPAAFLSERLGEIGLLAVGMGWVSAGLVAMAITGTFLQLMVFSFLAGLGGSTQHPIATSLISKSYEEGGLGSAVGFLNFSGDLGKIIFPLAIGFLLLHCSWRTVFTMLGVFGVLFSLVFWLFFRKRSIETRDAGGHASSPKGRGWGILDLKKFSILSLIGALDGSTRSTLLTFLPLLFTVQKGMSDSSASIMLSIILAGGACGKFGCGVLTDRMGVLRMIVVTEFLTAAFILLLLVKSHLWIIPLFFALGFMLNGTSTVLYATVAGIIEKEKRTRGYGLFYTIYLLSSALAPMAYGMIGNVAGLHAIFVGIAIATFAIIPLALISFAE